MDGWEAGMAEWLGLGLGLENHSPPTNVARVEFVVGSRFCFEDSFPDFPVFLPPQESTF